MSVRITERMAYSIFCNLVDSRIIKGQICWWMQFVGLTKR